MRVCVYVVICSIKFIYILMFISYDNKFWVLNRELKKGVIFRNLQSVEDEKNRKNL